MNSALSAPSAVVPLRTVSASSSNETVDITKSRNLLRRTSESSLTPRKRALARKSSKLFDSDITPVGSTGSSPSIVSPRSTDEHKRIPAQDIDGIEERTTLFEFPKAEIFTFDDTNGNMADTTSQGRLLGHGKFEIFQLHHQRVTYLQCGSVVHPILPRLKILKISRNQFILPLSNPERYWRIYIATGDNAILKQIETVFTKVCHFRNLFIQTTETIKEEPTKPLIIGMSVTAASPFLTTKPETLQKSDSLSSITTAVACFNLESDTSTFVEDLHQNDDPFKANTLQKTASHTSTLDLALDSFFEEPEVTQYYTPDPSVVYSHLEESRETIIPSSTLPLPSLHPPKLRTQSRSSRSASLYQTESSWMDPTDDMSTSTPATQRYVKLNLNPTPKTAGKVVRNPTRSSSIAEPILGKVAVKNDRSKYRYSSFDVYNMVKDSSVEELADGDTSFGSFLKSFF